MGRIALLDTAVDPGRIHCKAFSSYRICEAGRQAEGSAISHGTACAMVLDQFASDYELVHIQILSEPDVPGKKPMGDVRCLKEGLSLCRKLGVDIISLSAVSSLLSDSGCLLPILQELSEKSIIVSALDNRHYITIPASYPFAVGVQSDPEGLLCPGELAYQSKDIFGAGLYANCDMQMLKKMGIFPSNSFAVPVAVARINEWVDNGMDVWQCIRQLKPYRQTARQQEEFWERQDRIRDLPVVLVSGADGGAVYAACQKAMDCLYLQHEVQTCALCSMDGGLDIRFRKRNPLRTIDTELAFMESHYKTDLVFVAAAAEEKEGITQALEVDIAIAVDGSNALYSFEGNRLVTPVSQIAESVYRILQ